MENHKKRILDLFTERLPGTAGAILPEGIRWRGTTATVKPVVLAVVVAFTLASAARASIEFKTDGATLRLASRNGAVESLVAYDGTERIVPAAEAFTLQLLNGKGEPTRLKSSDFAFSHDGSVLAWRYKGETRSTAAADAQERAASGVSGLTVRMSVAATGCAFSFTPSVEGIPAGMLLEWFDGPQICISPDRKLFWPEWDGIEVTKFAHLYRPAGYRERFAPPGGTSLYPGLAQMQFMAAYKDGKGAYFSAVDDRHTPKAVEWEQIDGKSVRLSLQTFCGDLDKDGAWRPKFRYLLRPYEGGWMEACEIYRDWVRTLPAFQTAPTRPKWMYDSPVNLIYPIRGYGRDKGRDMKPNRMFPYVNAMPAVEKYGRLFDSRIMALLMHWEGTAPWAPPYVWPPYGGEAELAKFRDALHRRGDKERFKKLKIGLDSWWLPGSELPKHAKLTVRATDEGKAAGVKHSPVGLPCSHFFSDKELGPADRMVPLMAGTNPLNGQPAVAACVYLLDGDMKGRVVVSGIQAVRTTAFPVTERMQGVMYARAMGVSFAEGLEALFWYSLRARERDRFYSEDNFGMVHANLVPKQAWLANKAFITQRPAGSKNLGGEWRRDGLYFPQWSRPDGRVGGMVWTDRDAREMTLVFDADGVVMHDVWGKPAAVTGNGRKWLVEVTGEPLYFTGAKLLSME